MTHTMKIMDHNGHSTKLWDPELTETVGEVRTAEEVEAEFNKLVHANGMTAYKTTGPKSAELITKFDKEAEEILITPRLVGG